MSYRHVYLSPHLDDAALSCGGLIHRLVQAGRSVLVITIFAGSAPEGEISDFAQLLHDRWNLGDDPLAGRRQEDERAIELLGARHLHLSYLDCIYRRSPTNGESLYVSREDIFGDIDPAERTLPQALAVDLVSRLPLSGKVALYVPLAIGNHVDHQITRQAGILLAQRGYDLRCYEDYPYAASTGDLEKTLGNLPGTWHSELKELSETDMDVKLAAIAEYASQLEGLFGGHLEMVSQTRDFYASLAQGNGYAERYWGHDITRS